MEYFYTVGVLLPPDTTYPNRLTKRSSSLPAIRSIACTEPDACRLPSAPTRLCRVRLRSSAGMQTFEAESPVNSSHTGYGSLLVHHGPHHQQSQMDLLGKISHPKCCSPLWTGGSLIFYNLMEI